MRLIPSVSTAKTTNVTEAMTSMVFFVVYYCDTTGHIIGQFLYSVVLIVFIKPVIYLEKIDTQYIGISLYIFLLISILMILFSMTYLLIVYL